jgi:hypothetical protein
MSIPRSNHHYDELARLRSKYRDKRTIGWQLLDDCIQLVESTVAENDAYQAGRLDETQADNERLREHLASARAQVKKLADELSEKRTLREERERQGDEVKVSIDRSLKGWQVSDLEEIAYRLRCGGAVDETPVKVTDYTASALVPAPDLVRLERPSHPAALPAAVPSEPNLSLVKRAITHPTLTTQLGVITILLSMLLWVVAR